MFQISLALFVALWMSACSWAAPLVVSHREANEPKPLYIDVTSTHLPAGLTVHSMDAEFVDVDEDGDLDIAVAVEGGHNLLLLNDGKGKFTHSDALSKKRGDSEDIAIADFNRDGHSDIAFVAEDSDINEFYTGDGLGGFTLDIERIGIHDKSNAVIAEDINRDGFADLIVGSSVARTSLGVNAFLMNDGTGHFTNESAKRLPNVQDETQDLIMGDVNGDGFRDLVVANEGRNRLYFNQGDGTFVDESARLDIPEKPRQVTREVCLGDVDSDGDLDIAFFNTGGDTQNRLLINDGKGNFFDETATRLPKRRLRTWDGAMVDVNNDGHLDIISANSEGPVMGAPFHVMVNDGTGHFVDDATLFPPDLIEAGWDIEAGDLNGDGYLDFYLCGRSNSKTGQQSQDRLLLGVPGRATKIKAAKREKSK